MKQLQKITLFLQNDTYEQLAELAGGPEGVTNYAASLLAETLNTLRQSKPNGELGERKVSPNFSSETKANLEGKKLTESELLKEVVVYLREHGGGALKVDVEQALHQKFLNLFSSPYYAQKVGGGVPRWKKNIQFARNTARGLGLIKSPEDSRRGTWELTEAGKNWQNSQSDQHKTSSL